MSELKQLGKTQVRVPHIGLGTAPIADLYRPITDQEAQDTVKFALQNGMTLFDTAPLYGNGLSERRVGAALRGVPRDSYVLETKVGRLIRNGKPVFDFTRDGILRSFEESLERLGLDRVDVLLIHDPDEHYQIALDQAFPALADLRAQGVIKAVGAGMNQYQMLVNLARNADFDCFLLAGRYTLLEQGSLEALNFFHERNIGIFAGGVFNSGILATGAKPGAKYQYANAPKAIFERAQRIERICARYNVPMKAAAIAIVGAHPAITALVIGAENTDQARENLTASQTPVPIALWEDLRKEGLLDAAAPLPA